MINQLDQICSQKECGAIIYIYSQDNTQKPYFQYQLFNKDQYSDIDEKY